MNKKLFLLPILFIIIFTVSCGKDTNNKTDVKNTTATPDITPVKSIEDTESPPPSKDEATSVQNADEYVFTCLDQDNAPVRGVRLQICTEEVCTMKESDENGEIRFSAALYNYDIHVYSVPKEYELLSEKDFNTGNEYGTFKISFNKK